MSSRIAMWSTPMLQVADNSMTCARLETYNPYSDPSNEMRDTYEQLNATLGFKASPVTGLWFNLFAGYQNLKDDLYQIENSWIGGTGGQFH